MTAALAVSRDRIGAGIHKIANREEFLPVAVRQTRRSHPRNVDEHPEFVMMKTRVEGTHMVDSCD